MRVLKSKTNKVTFIIFLVYATLIFFSTGEDTSYAIAVFTSIYAGLVVATIAYILMKLISLLIKLIQKSNKNKSSITG